MAFKKISSAEVLGILEHKAWKKTANSKVISHYMDNELAINLEERLDAVADIYKISRDPSDYLLIPARANSIGRFNANLDGWTFDEIIEFRPTLGCRTYSTYNNKPHFVEHNASRYEVARGVILDSHLNMDNEATDEIKNDVMRCIGSDANKDAFVEVILAVDQSKDPALANAYKSGAITTFSMGADVESTMCNICGNVATTTWSFCDHIRKKHNKIPYTMADGSTRIAGELCKGTIFQELSVVADPADKTAVIQDGILSILKAASTSDQDVQEIVKFTAKYAKEIPESLAMILNKFFEQKGF
jgi:hypothetical protein